MTVIATLLAAEHDLAFLHGCTAKDGGGWRYPFYKKGTSHPHSEICSE
jgi:hypothetical protein